MKALLITAPASGSGKTTITMGIIRAMLNKGLKVCAFKTGPDYIDRAFLEKASRKRAGNLDMFLQGREGMYNAISMASAEYCIIEGAMGYFDGNRNGYINSSYDISRELGINSVLIYTPKGEMFSIIPKIKGMAEFEESNIKAVIFNNISEKYYKMIKDAMEKHTDIKVLGYIPKLEEVKLESRHLGLVQSIEIDDIEARIEKLAETVQKSIDMNELIKLMKDVEVNKEVNVKKRNIKVAIAMDKAFSFYYTENIKLLEMTCKIEYFSPMHDKSIPDCDLLYLGGGYPEVFEEELSSNKDMLVSIRRYAENGGYIYSECGGFMYLCEYIDSKPMVGIFKGECKMTKSLNRFGYIDVQLKKACMLGEKGDKLTAHEFHRSEAKLNHEPILAISRTMKDGEWECGYIYKNTYGGYPHINFIGNIKVFNNILDSIEKRKKV